MTRILEILPQYTQLNSTIRNVVSQDYILFAEQQFVTDFHTQFKDIQSFETMVIELMMQSNTEHRQTLIQSLQTKIQNNIHLITTNRQILENINIEKACHIFANQYETQISNQLHNTQKVWKEFREINNSLDIIGFREHTDREEKRLWEKHETLTERYKAKKHILNNLYEKQEIAKKTAKKYRENCFLSILSLSQKFGNILEKYIPKEKTDLQSGVYFDMAIVSAIHKECNDEQFEDISELDLYAILNLLPSTGKFTIKKGERNRIYYLIHKLYELLPKENNQVWRTAILQSFKLNERIYQSKYRISKGKDTTPELVEFSKRLDKLFKNYNK